MRTEAPALLPIFRSRLQAELLSRVLLRPGQEFTLTRLANDLGVSKAGLHSEAQRLIDAHLLTDRRQGKNRLVSANLDHPAAGPLTQLALLSFGPHEIIADEFADLAGAEQVIIFGSWAARYAGEPGPPPNDIDVLVIGDTSRQKVFDAADRAERRLGRPVNPEQASPMCWKDSSDSTLLTEIKRRPFFTVHPPARSPHTRHRLNVGVSPTSGRRDAQAECWQGRSRSRRSTE